MYYLLVLTPLLGALIAWLIPCNERRPLTLPVTALLHAAVVATMAIDRPAPSHGGWIHLDAIGTIILISITVLFLFCSVYAVGYLRIRSERANRILCSCLLVCLAAMSAATVSRHLGMLWLAIETSTLTMAPLIYFNHNARSLEATWKYMLICSISIALALLGLFILAYATVVARVETTLLLEPLMATAGKLSPAWLNAGFVFLLVGFGTKMGLAPLHTWKPDSYGEAPGLVGALLAGGLTNCAVLGLLRVYQVAAASPSALFLRDALVVLGILSMFISAAFLLRQNDFKRMLAYSSVEQMGIIAIALGVGRGALFGALFHLLNNCLAKGAMFLASGNIHRSYETKSAQGVRGALRRLPFSGGIFLAALFAVTGSPPFGTFASGFAIVSGIFEADRWLLAGTFLLLMALVFVGMASTVLPMVMGNPPEDRGAYHDQLLTVAPPLILVLAVLILGVSLPAPLHDLLREATALLEHKP